MFGALQVKIGLMKDNCRIMEDNCKIIWTTEQNQNLHSAHGMLRI